MTRKKVERKTEEHQFGENILGLPIDPPDIEGKV
jgi:hypothetical protein